MGKSDHNQIHFDINVKSENKKTYRRNFHKGNYKEIRNLAKLDWNNIGITAVGCWSILKYEMDSTIDKFVPLKKKQGKRSKKKHLSKEAIRKIANKLCGGFIGVPERMNTMQITKRHLMQLRLKLDNLKEAMSKNWHVT